MHPFTLRSFRLRVRNRKKSFISFLRRIGKKPPRLLDSNVQELESHVWHEVDCLACAHCCKAMTPTYTGKDISRIAKYLDMKPAEMKLKWLKKERGTGDWINKSTPCQFLDLQTNKCQVYDVRPADCAGFPHLSKKKMVDYIHVHEQNVEMCPATFKLVEKMMYLFEK